jgi:hypothetical protein
MKTNGEDKLSLTRVHDFARSSASPSFATTGNGRIVVAPQISPLFRRIAGSWLHLQHCFSASVSAKR